MAAVDDPKTLGRTRLSFADEADIDEFVATLRRFERGELTPDAWRAFRLVRGTYGQRQAADAQMLRVKVPQGILEAHQLEALADVGERYSRGFGHITTRQNIQFHFIKLGDVERAMRSLADAGLTTREACGNSVRNITACPYAGVAADEVFDVTPYAEALTRYLLRHPLSASLPRKFKIAFEGCPENHAVTAINDIGWRAVVRGNGNGIERGFRVTAGGGTSILCSAGHLLYDFLPAGELLEVAEAIVRVFHRFGDYQHKQRNRMKFLIKTLGWPQWREAFELALEEFRGEGGAALPFDPQRPAVEHAPDWGRPAGPSPSDAAMQAAASRVEGPGLVPQFRRVPHGDFWHWWRTNVRQQRQHGYCIVSVTLPLGDFTAGQMRLLAQLARAYADGTVRVTPEQNLLFRWVPVIEVPEVYRRLVAAGLGLADAATIADVTSCPGAESCRLAVTQSRGLGRLLEEHLRARPALIDTASDLKIKISGCPNGCGHHHIAGVGFQGSVRKVGGRAVPQYFLMLGGSVGEIDASFGRLAAKIPARRAPEALERLIAWYRREGQPGETATAFFRRADLAGARQLLSDLEHLTPEELRPEDYVDLAEDHEYRPEVQDGECSA
jgi:sulfite reductase beta subunit-like hemoprotein